MPKGSCLCGEIQFDVVGPIQGLSHCHCSMCRKAHGAPFSTFAQVASGDLRIVAAQDQVRSYRSSEQVERSFCGGCGSNFTFRVDGLPATVWIAAGLFEDDSRLRPQHHIFVGSKASWYEITDQLPQYEAYPPLPAGS